MTFVFSCAAALLRARVAAFRTGISAESGLPTFRDADGRLKELMPPGTPLADGTYRLTFGTAEYFAAGGTPAFYPSVTIVFAVSDASQHYHVPLLLSPFGYSTYRGS